MSGSLGTAIISVVVFIAFIVVVLSWSHNSNVNQESLRANNNFCQYIGHSIQNDKSTPSLNNITIVELEQYKEKCTG